MSKILAVKLASKFRVSMALEYTQAVLECQADFFPQLFFPATGKILFALEV